MQRNTRKNGIQNSGGSVAGGPYCRPASDYVRGRSRIEPGEEPYVNRGFTRTTYWNPSDKSPIDPRQLDYYAPTSQKVRVKKK